jgi:serine/threonine protein kinase
MDLGRRQTVWPGKTVEQRVRSNAGLAHQVFPVRVARMDRNPWHHYTRLYITDQGGPVFVCNNSGKSQKIVAVKAVPCCIREDLKKVRDILHENVVTFSAAYYFEKSIYFISDLMSVDLTLVMATPRGALPLEEVATVLHSTLSGLYYIHKTLHLAYSNLTGENILLNRNGYVKLGMRLSPSSTLHFCPY